MAIFIDKAVKTLAALTVVLPSIIHLAGRLNKGAARTSIGLTPTVAAVSPRFYGSALSDRRCTSNPSAAFGLTRGRSHPETELQRLRGLTLLPGMPVEAYIETGERTAMSYLIKPLFAQINSAMLED